MMGTSDGRVPGLYLLASYDIIQFLNMYTDLELHLSFYEIYCGKLFDLLNDRAPIHCREDGKQQVNIVNLTEVQVDTVEAIMSTLQIGMHLRASGATGANAESSRSHAIMQMVLKHNGRHTARSVLLIWREVKEVLTPCILINRQRSMVLKSISPF